MTEEQTLRRAIVEVGRLLYERKLIVATDGNLSVRLDKRIVLMTPAGHCKGFLREDDIVRVPVTGRDRQLAAKQSPQGRTGHRPSSEMAMHLATYLARPDISAIVHAHPPFATSFAVSGRKLNHELLPETSIFDGPIGRVRFLPSGSFRLADAVAAALTKHNVCLLARHGAVTVGSDLLDAYYRMERLEFLAQVTALARSRAQPAASGPES